MKRKGVLYSLFFGLFLAGCAVGGVKEECRLNSDCPGDELCRDGRCYLPSRDDTGSTGGSGDQTGKSGGENGDTPPECISDLDCASGERCIRERCIESKKKERESCNDVSECESGLLCIVAPDSTEGICSRRCTVSRDCLPGDACYRLKDGGGTKVCAKLLFPPPDARCLITVRNAVVSGGCWDFGCGAPDPYVRIEIGGSTYKTSTISDSFSPTWDETIVRGVTFKEILSMVVEMVDKDVSSDDVMARWGPDEVSWFFKSMEAGFRLKSDKVDLSIFISCIF